MDILILAAVAVAVFFWVRSRKQKKSGGSGKPVSGGSTFDAETFGSFDSGASGSSAGFTPTGGGSSSAGKAAPAGDDDGSEFRFSSDEDFAAALGALTGEKVEVAPVKPAAIAEDAPQGVGAVPTYTGAGVVRCKINGKYDLEGTSARFENGKVYGLSANGEYLIGSYNEEITEVRNTRGEIIGRIDGNLIILTREGQVERLKAQGREKTPDELVLLCAERRGDRICSTENSEELALCSSDDRACAAAFICLHYDGDGIGPKESELHRFWYSWM